MGTGIVTHDIKTEVTTNCVCTQVDDEGDEVLDERGNSIPSDDCHGWCWDDMVYDFTDNMLGQWLAYFERDDSALLRIEGRGMGWRRTGGHTYCVARDTLDALGLEHTDYTLAFTWHAETHAFTCVRYSHDEPVGASFTIRLATDAEVELFEEHSRY
jgi:hypothetical protein